LILGRQNIAFSIEVFQKVIAVNLVRTVDVIRQLLPYTATQTPDDDGERGVIITVSLAAAFDGQPGQVAYSATKGAIASMTLPLARDLVQHGIRAVSISPGLFETSVVTDTPKKAKDSLQRALEFPSRPGRSDEVAELVGHSISNSMLNGTMVRLGGATRMPSRL
jgi:3-hydroxyacyl-CoA dehydrogenase / 3-hydroxy-2-methylbutyryl-CoA dehydrogenase